MTGIWTYRNFSLRDTPVLDSKVAVITGGQAGIGKEITTQLLLHGIEKIVILARSKAKFDDALQEWLAQKDTGLAGREAKVEFIQCDLGDICAVKNAADRIRQEIDRLDIVICNAGLGIAPQYKLSSQSIELAFATNCVGHQVLVTLLLPLMKETVAKYKTDVRIVVTSSSLHSICRSLDLDLLASPVRTKPAKYDGIWRYSRSKLGNILFTKELSRRLLSDPNPSSHQIYVNVFFPGNIATAQMDVWQEYFCGPFGWSIKKFFMVFGQSMEDGAATAVYLATSKEIVNGDGMRGEYFIPIAKKYSTTSIANDAELAQRLWDWVENRVTAALGDGWQTSSDGPPGGDHKP